ncbi:MAG: hypothetical protein ABEJ44_06500 [Halanaeroarchaeum sp.]
MNATPADVPFVWIALLVVSASVFGVVLSLPGAPPPDAERVAVVVDDVAATEHAAAAVIPLDATSIHLSRDDVALRGPGGTAHASLLYGPVTPVPRDGDLARVARGAPPEYVFATPEQFEHALHEARSAEPAWAAAGEQLYVRRVTYEGVDGVLLGQ